MEQAALANSEGIIYKLPPEFLKEFNDRFLRTVPAEKAAMELQEAQLARILKEEGAHQVNGLGQKMGKVPIREFMRWHQAKPNCWTDDEFVDEFFRDNPHLRAQGYKPRTRTGRAGRWNT